MKEIYIAEFRYGSPRLAKANLIKETSKQYHIENSTELIANFHYFPNRLEKSSYNVFFSYKEAIEFLLLKADEHIVYLSIEIAKTKEYINMLKEKQA